MLQSTNKTALTVARILLCLICALLGSSFAALFQLEHWIGVLLGLAFAALLIQIEVLTNGFSFRHFSNGTIGLLVGFVCAWLLNSIGLLELFSLSHLENDYELNIFFELALYIVFGFIGIALAIRAPREEFSLLIPYVRFLPQNSSQQQLVIDKSTLMDARLPAIIDSEFIGGELFVSRSTIKKIQIESESKQKTTRELAEVALQTLLEIRKRSQVELRITESPEQDLVQLDAEHVEQEALSLARFFHVPILTADPVLEKNAKASGIRVLSLSKLNSALRPELKPGDIVRITLSSSGKEEHQAVGYLNDGTMIIVNDSVAYLNQRVSAKILSLIPTSVNRMAFAEYVDLAEEEQEVES